MCIYVYIYNVHGGYSVHMRICVYESAITVVFYRLSGKKGNTQREDKLVKIAL